MHGYVIRAKEALEFSPAGAPRPSGHAVADRGGELRPPSAAALCRAGAGAHRARGRAARGGVLGARRARGAALFAARRRGAQEGRAARRRARIEPAALALAAARRGADRLDRRLHGDVRHRRELPRRSGCATPPAWSPTSAGARIPIIAASSRSASSRTRPSSASTIRAAPISRWRSSSATSACCTTRSCRRASANWPRPARSTAPACSARRCAWPTWSRPRSRACCRARRSRSSGIAWCCGSKATRAALAGERVSSRLKQLARLVGREPVVDDRVTQHG